MYHLFQGGQLQKSRDSHRPGRQSRSGQFEGAKEEETKSRRVLATTESAR